MEIPPSQPPVSPEADEATETTALLVNTNRHNRSEVKGDQILLTVLKMVLMLIGTILTFLILLVLYFAYTYGIILTGWPLPPLSTKDFNSTFSVGFDLTPSYGTAAVMYSNGTIVDIAKIDAPTGYVAMMQRLCLRSSTHLAAPYSGEIFEDFGDLPRKANRQRWKALGFAASKDVSKISELVTALRKETERHLGTTMHSAVVAYPDLLALYREDIDDALEHSQLRTLSLEKRFSLTSSMCQYNGTNLCYQPHHLAAAYAGNGLGICRDFINETACRVELRELPSYDTMELLYTRASFSGSLEADMRSAYRPPGYEHDYPRSKFIDWDGGLDSLGDSSDPEGYWDLVRRHIVDLIWPFSWAPERPVSTVLLVGESAGDEEFIRVLNDTFLQEMGHLPTIYSSDPVYMAARGAAEFAMQLQGIIADREG